MAVLHTILMGLHLLAVNVAAAGPLVCIWLYSRAGQGDACADQVGRRLAWASFYSLLVASAIGGLLVVLAWFDQQTGYWQAVGRFSSREYGFAAAELVFSFVCLWIYARTWDRWLTRPWLHGLVAVLSATNLLYHFPPLMTVLGELAVRPELAAEETITHAVFRQLMVRPDVLAQVLHFMVASLAVSGWALMCVARQERGQESTVESQEPKDVTTSYDRLVSAGAWIALAASLAQLAVGVWVLMVLPITTRYLLLGNDWLTTGLFVLAIVASFAMLHLLATVALGDTSDVAVRRSGMLILIVVLLMVAMMSRVRRLEVRSPGIDLLAAEPSVIDSAE